MGTSQMLLNVAEKTHDSIQNKPNKTMSKLLKGQFISTQIEQTDNQTQNRIETHIIPAEP